MSDLGTPLNPVPVNEERCRKYLADRQFPPGISTAIIQNLEKVPFRFFICDDSGSMMMPDGKHVVNSRDVACSRWTELGEALEFHIGLAKAANAPSQFRMLNQLSPKLVGVEEADPDSMGARAVLKVIEGGPSGGTPLCKHIREVTKQISAWAPTLRENGQKVSVIIATDGSSSDGDVVAALRPLKDLPVLMVIRLCTNEDKTVEYWDQVEKDLETELDIIDDLFGEAEGVMGVNPWINYGNPLQRLREFGVHIKEMDMIDESQLTDSMMRKVLSVLFNEPMKSVPDNRADWDHFSAWVNERNLMTPKTFNPSTSTITEEYWINAKKLKELYGPPGSCCTIA